MYDVANTINILCWQSPCTCSKIETIQLTISRITTTTIIITPLTTICNRKLPLKQPSLTYISLLHYSLLTYIKALGHLTKIVHFRVAQKKISIANNNKAITKK